MGVLDFLKVAKKASPTAQIAEMEAQLDRLRAEMKGVNEIVESHGQRRANMLLTDASDADIAKLDTDLSLARIRAERLELAELELIERIAAARDSADRSARAAAIDAAAAAISAKTDAVDTAAEALAVAFRDLLATIPPELIDFQARKRGFNVDIQAGPYDVAASITSQALANAAPELFEICAPQGFCGAAAIERFLEVRDIDHDGLLSPVLLGERGELTPITSAALSAERIVVSRLRRRASALRGSGDVREAAE